MNNNINFLEKLNQGLKRNVFWNKLRSEITTQRKNNNLDCTVDLTFRNSNRLLVLSYKNGYNDPTRTFCVNCCIPLVEIKDFNVLINHFLINPYKTNSKHIEKLSKCQKMM